ncbi:MAG: cyclic pyranopterin monophosphate synthase MoaC [Mucispirillum sp.]|nr:cyclic pyranopterin monophosphate synthase MoaC [Mucispirillum sp.]
MEFTHFDEKGASRMVDVSGKTPTKREATATGRVTMNKDTLQQIVNMSIKKGNVFEVARIAAIMAVKQTPHLIPLCHPLAISKVNVDFNYNLDNGQVDIEVTVGLDDKTGVEMEALTGVSVAALTIYDMCKAVDKDMIISDIMLQRKSGGKSGEYIRSGRIQE